VLGDPDAAPSARVLAAMARDHENSHERFVLAQSHRHRDAILDLPLAADTADRFARLASESADLLYHLLVLLESRGVALDDVWSELERRVR